MIKQISLNVFLFIAIVALSLSGSYAQPVDTKTAATILSGVSAKYKTFTTVKATFSMKSESSANAVTEQQSEIGRAHV